MASRVKAGGLLELVSGWYLWQGTQASTSAALPGVSCTVLSSVLSISRVIMALACPLSPRKHTGWDRVHVLLLWGPGHLGLSSSGHHWLK